MFISKRTLVIVASVVIVTVVGFLFFFFFSSGSGKLLDRAKAYASMGEVEKAIDSYKEYLLKEPNDLKAKLEYAEMLGKEGEYGKAFGILNSLDEQTLIGQNKDLRKDVLNATIILDDNVADRTRGQGQRLLLEGKFAEAKERFESALFLRQDWLRNSNAWDVLAGIRKREEVRSREENPVVRDYKVDVAYVRWLAGDAVHVFDDLSLDSLGHLRYAEKMNELGHKLFKDEKLSASKDAWLEAWTCFTQYGRLKSDEDIAKIKFNLAVCYGSQKLFSNARLTLLELRREAPRYEPGQVAELLRLVTR
jgi:tetratricopeptide (TPR) repeat protein